MRNFDTIRFLKFKNFLNTFDENVFFTFLKSFTIFFGVNQQSWVFLESTHPKQSPCGVLLCSRQVSIIRFFQNHTIWTKLEKLDKFKSVLEKSYYCNLPATQQYSTW